MQLLPQAWLTSERQRLQQGAGSSKSWSTSLSSGSSSGKVWDVSSRLIVFTSNGW